MHEIGKKRCTNCMISIECFKNAFEIEPTATEHLLNLATLIGDSGEYKTAISLFSMILEKDPLDFQAYFGRAVCYDACEMHTEALKDYDSAIKIDPNNPDLWHAKAFALQNMERFDEAVIAYQKSVSLEPENIECRNDLGIALLELKRIDEAKHTFEEIIQMAPKWSEGYYSLAKVYAVEMAIDNAANYLSNAIKLDPSKEKRFLREFPKLLGSNENMMKITDIERSKVGRKKNI